MLSQLGDHLLATLGVASGDHHRGTLPGGGAGDRRAQALGAAADQHHLPGQQVLHDDSNAAVIRFAAFSQPGLATAAGSRPGQHVEDALGGVDVGGRAALPAHPHQVRGEHDVGVIEQRVVLRRFGVEDIQPHPAEPAVLQRRVDGVEVGESAAAAVDQDRAGLDVLAAARTRPGGGWTPAAAGAG